MSENNIDDYTSQAFDILIKKSKQQLEELYINSDPDISNLVKSVLCQLALINEWDSGEFDFYIQTLDNKRKQKKTNNNNLDILESDIEKKSWNVLINIYVNSEDETLSNLAKSELNQRAIRDDWDPGEFSFYLEELTEQKNKKKNI